MTQTYKKQTIMSIFNFYHFKVHSELWYDLSIFSHNSTALPHMCLFFGIQHGSQSGEDVEPNFIEFNCVIHDFHT